MGEHINGIAYGDLQKEDCVTREQGKVYPLPHSPPPVIMEYQQNHFSDKSSPQEHNLERDSVSVSRVVDNEPNINNSVHNVQVIKNDRPLHLEETISIIDIEHEPSLKSTSNMQIVNGNQETETTDTTHTMLPMSSPLQVPNQEDQDYQKTIPGIKEGILNSSDIPVTDGAGEADNERETLYQSYLNFESPLMALDYKKAFNSSENNYTKGCKWSPDGSCLLVASNDNKMRLLNLPQPLQQSNFPSETWFCSEAEQYGYAAVTVKERELVYDYTWYPAMRSDNPRTCCFAVTCRDHPVHLWDAWNGQLICSYYSYDHLDQMVAAHSTGFNLDGSRLVCGFRKCLRVFHTNRPGRYFEKIDAKGQPGILSCVAFNPQLPSIMVAGSYLGSLGLYNTQRNNLFMRMDGCMGGVTQVQFSADGTKLFSGMRKTNEILCWDIRNPGNLLCGYKREVATNQRISFDLDLQQNRHLVTGETSGQVSQWDMLCTDGFQTAREDLSLLEPTSTFSAHKDCTNGVSLHPYCPILATSSGQRHFPEPLSDTDSSSDTDSGPDELSKPLFCQPRSPQENTVKLWWLGR